MAGYFDDPEKQRDLKIICEEWIGTPYRHHVGVKGHGADCIHFVARVFEEMGILKWRKNIVPDYPRDWHLHNTRELLLERLIAEMPGVSFILAGGEPEILRRLGATLSPDPHVPMNGDILLSHYGRAASHAAIYFEGHVYQAVEKIGVCKTHFSDPTFRRQMKYAHRVSA
jgi:cell wall-associated NlpC family hydrolase